MAEHAAPTRMLGSSGLEVSALGLGCLPMSGNYGLVDDAESIATIHRAIELGVFFLDTAAMYGNGHNEQLVGRAIAGRRDELILSSKCGRSRDPERSKGPDGRPESLKLTCEDSLRRLNVDYLDLYYLHRVDPKVPIEDSVGALAELVAAGKVRHLGLSEASSESIERASAVYPITALQSEWSLWARELEDEVLGTARRLGIGIVPFSPLGRGFLAGRIASPDELDASDHRRRNERYQGERFQHNNAVLADIRKIAEEAGLTPAQLALGWLLAQGDDVVPIPGAQRREYIEENVNAWSAELSSELCGRLEAIIPQGVWQGAIFPGGLKTRVYGDTPRKGDQSG